MTACTATVPILAVREAALPIPEIPVRDLMETATAASPVMNSQTIARHMTPMVLPAMTACTATVPIPAVREAALPMPGTPALRPSATPVRKRPTAALIPQAPPVPMTAMDVPMMSVMGLEPVHTPITTLAIRQLQHHQCQQLHHQCQQLHHRCQQFVR